MITTADRDGLLTDLDVEQRRAVTTEHTLVAVIAGAGSGKTRVLTRRIAWRIAEGSAAPQHTLALTFTREAAGELRRRLPGLGLSDRIEAGTFHAVAARLLRQHWTDRGRRPPGITGNRRALIASLPDVRRSELDGLMVEIDWAATRGLSGTAYLRAAATRRTAVSCERVAQTLDAYAELKRRRGLVDLEDLLVQTTATIERDAEFAEGLRWRYRHLLVDEAQDLNPLQHRLVDLLRSGRDDLFLVGDPAQAIYGFTGADPSLLVDVETRFPGIEVVRLTTNHRSTQQVVDAGVHVLGTAATATRSSRGDGEAVGIHMHADDGDEARSTAAAIAAADPALVRRGAIAVLARTHVTLDPVRAALRDLGVRLRRDGASRPGELRDLLRSAEQCSTSDALRGWISDLGEEIDDDDVDSPPREQDVRVRVYETLLTFLRERPTGDGGALRTWIDETDAFEEQLGGVELATFHAAKGREWHTVHLIGCESGLVPHRSATTTARRDEERRLFYVALTRATDRAHVHGAARRGGYRRTPTALLDGFESNTPDVIPPPSDLVGRRSHREETLDRLRAWRQRRAHAAGVVPEAICPDHVLAVIADERPVSVGGLAEVTGIGSITARSWFADIDAALHPDR